MSQFVIKCQIMKWASIVKIIFKIKAQKIENWNLNLSFYMTKVIFNLFN